MVSGHTLPTQAIPLGKDLVCDQAASERKKTRTGTLDVNLLSMNDEDILHIVQSLLHSSYF